MFQHAKAVLPLETGVRGAVMERGLRIQVELRGPPRIHTVFQLRPVRMKVVSRALRTEGRKIFDLEVSRFLKVVIVGNEVGIFLGRQRLGKNRGTEQDGHQEGRVKASQSNLLAAVI